MHAWNATTMMMAKPRRLLRARLDLVMLQTAIAFPHTGKVDRGIAPRRESEGPAAFSDRCHYALIRRPYNACMPGGARTCLQSRQDPGWSRHARVSLTGWRRMGGHSNNR